jgi:ribose transport system substrate-binding protein
MTTRRGQSRLESIRNRRPVTGPSRIRSARKGVAAVGVAALAVAAIAACGSSSGGSGSGSTASIPAAKELSQLRQTVAKASASASGTFSPGPAITDMAALKGKKIMALPGTTLIPTCKQDAETIKSIGDAAGTPVTMINDTGELSQWDSAIDLAISQHYAAVDFMCDDVPSLIIPELEKAAAAGVKVFGYALTEPLNSYPGLAGGTLEPTYSDYSAMLDQAFVATGGKAINLLVISSVAVIGNAQNVAKLKAQVSRMCGSACHVYVSDVEVPDWGTKVQPTVQTQLLTHPNINVVYPMFSGEYTYTLPAVEASHRNVIVTGAFGGGTPQVQLQTNSATNKIIIGDMTSDPVWAAYEMYYQTMLDLAGQPMRPLNDTYTPNILITTGNASKVLSGAAWGFGFVNSYRQDLGLPALSGSALQAAATVGS